MNTGTTIVGIILILICIIPFVIISRNKRSREKQLRNTLRKMAEEQGRKIVQQDLWSDSAIGIDQSGFQLYVIHDHESGLQRRFISLKDMQKCRLNQINRRDGITEKIEMVLTPKEKNKPTEVVEFYNALRDGSVLSGELELGARWNNMIHEILSTVNSGDGL